MTILVGSLVFISCTKKQYEIIVTASPLHGGYVTGAGIFDDQSIDTLTAIAKEGYQFIRWQDGNTDNPRIITVTADEEYTAYFESFLGETCVNVTFDGTIWNAHAIKGLYDTVSGLWNIYALETDGSLPIVDIASSIKSDAQSATADDHGVLGNSLINRVEYYDYTFLQDQSGYIHGDYWAKQVTISVSKFDADNLLLSCIVDAEMFNAYEAFIDTLGVDSAYTANMTVIIRQLQLEDADASMPSKNVTGKLTPGKPGQVPFVANKPRRK